jgi:NAD(P)-dependent dehydrogenase (short-subunit alcohol dehydrogenase family)
MRLQDKVCVVTGGGSGIGAATCALFAREGAKLVVADLNLEAAQAVADAANAAGGTAVATAVDVSDSAAARKMIDFALAEFGRLDVLVNNAGFGFAGSVVDTDEADWDRLMSVNLKGVFLGCKHAIPVMQRQGGGAIVNTASVVANVGVRDRAAYCASKGGVAALTRAMALDHVDAGIRVNAVAPGTIDSPYFDRMLAKVDDPAAFKKGITERQAMGRLGKPEEIAGAILYLASDEASFVTGSLLTVDGGMTAQ